MARRPSDGALAWLREAMARQGITTAELAARSDQPRAVVRRVLAGREPLTVDQWVAWAGILGLQEAMAAGAVLPSAADAEGPGEPLPSPSGEEGVRSGPRLAAAVEGPPPEDEPGAVVGRPFQVDPLDVHARQAVRLAFATGMDVSLLLDTGELEDSGIPRSVLERFPERVNIRLDAAYHRHNQPVLEDGHLVVVLSFDALYTCRIPWSAVRHVVLEPVPPPPPDRESAPPGPGLRLVKG